MKNLKLKAARAAKDLSQDELAKLCGVSRQTISAIEKGEIFCRPCGFQLQVFHDFSSAFSAR